MNAYVDKAAQSESQSTQNGAGQVQVPGESGFSADNHPVAAMQRRVQGMADNSPRVKAVAALQRMANQGAQGSVVQRINISDEEISVLEGMELALKSIESGETSGMDGRAQCSLQ